MRLRIPAWLLFASALLCACGGGGGGGATPAVVFSPTPTPTVTTPPSSSASVQTGPATTASFATIAAGYGGSVVFPAAIAGGGTTNLVLAASNTVAVQASTRLPKAIGGSLDPLAYVTLTTTATVTFAAWPTFTFVLPAGISLPPGAALYLGYDPGNTAGNWSTLAGPGTINASSVTFAPLTGPITFTSGTTYVFALFATAQVLVAPTPAPSPTRSPSPTPSPSPSASAATAFSCPATGAAPASFARNGTPGEATRRPAARGTGTAAAAGTTLLAVSYDRSRAFANAVQIASRERVLGLSLVRRYDFPHRNVTMRVVAVPANAAAQAEAALSSQDGVRSVAITGQRRYRTTTSPFYTNDPYFQGFAPVHELLPYAESPSVPGQWDMHAIGLEHAFGYSLPGATYAATASALGSASIKIAIIDTGEDASHPDLSGKIVYQHCFITNADGTQQSTGTFSTDEDGHGTDVSGIAAAASNNSLGFTAAGGNAVLYGYRVFPTPDDNCLSDGSSDAQCSAATQDIASAILDAVEGQHVNIISISLGGGGCSPSGVDTDPVEGQAIAEAIAANVVVVAAAGNSGTSGLSAPGCDNGVIAAGATSLDDGLTTGTTGHYTSSQTSTASSTNIVEYVAAYSQWGNPSANPHDANAWGIVAPGGDPSASEVTGTADDLHWIENIWTSTPFDVNFSGQCASDFGTASVPDCRTLIAGTSMATPHVAGAAALILAVNPSYQSPTAMKTLLCQTADDLSDSHQGCGRLNVYRAMAVAIRDTSRP
jgi:hypothetical protein